MLNTCENTPSAAAPPTGAAISATWLDILLVAGSERRDINLSSMPGEISVARIGSAGA